MAEPAPAYTATGNGFVTSQQCPPAADEIDEEEAMTYETSEADDETDTAGGNYELRLPSFYELGPEMMGAMIHCTWVNP